jgi:hypothetical protein
MRKILLIPIALSIALVGISCTEQTPTGVPSDDLIPAALSHKAGGTVVDPSGDSPNGKSLVRHGKDVFYVFGNWFRDGNTIYTYQGGVFAGFRFLGLESGKYEIQIMAKHWVERNKQGVLPIGFKGYDVMIAADQVATNAIVPASSTNWEKGTVVLDLRGGKIDVLVSWRNCAKDVSFQIHSIMLKRIGDSTR